MLLKELLHNQFAAQHIHSAGEGKFAALVGRKFNRRGFVGWQIFRNSEIAENDLLAARRSFVTVEIKSDRNILFDDDNIGRVAAFNRNFYFLQTKFVLLDGNMFALAEKIPERQANQSRAADYY